MLNRILSIILFCSGFSQPLVAEIGSIEEIQKAVEFVGEKPKFVKNQMELLSRKLKDFVSNNSLNNAKKHLAFSFVAGLYLNLMSSYTDYYYKFFFRKFYSYDPICIITHLTDTWRLYTKTINDGNFLEEILMDEIIKNKLMEIEGRTESEIEDYIRKSAQFEFIGLMDFDSFSYYVSEWKVLNFFIDNADFLIHEMYYLILDLITEKEFHEKVSVFYFQGMYSWGFFKKKHSLDLDNVYLSPWMEAFDFMIKNTHKEKMRKYDEEGFKKKRKNRILVEY